jgi:hypothetical protein
LEKMLGQLKIETQEHYNTAWMLEQNSIENEQLKTRVSDLEFLLQQERQTSALLETNQGKYRRRFKSITQIGATHSDDKDAMEHALRAQIEQQANIYNNIINSLKKQLKHDSDENNQTKYQRRSQTYIEKIKKLQDFATKSSEGTDFLGIV